MLAPITVFIKVYYLLIIFVVKVILTAKNIARIFKLSA